MPDQSARLSLPYLLPAQAQKHVTHNEALQLLDMIVQLTVEEFGAHTPPPLPEAGQIWALGDAPSGAWIHEGGKLAAWLGSGWLFIAPRKGWRAARETELRLWDGTAWIATGAASLDTVDGLGINASHDATNRLVVAAAATLLTHEGAGHQLKINKALASDTASLLFQTGWSGRAEMGTAGSDSFEIKVSADGGAWATGLSVDPASGAVSAPNGITAPSLSGDAVTQSPIDATAGRLLKTGDFGLGAVQAPDIPDLDDPTLPGGAYRTLQATPGTYPAGAGTLGHVLVLKHEAGSGFQFFLPVGDSASADRIFSRVYDPAAGTWRAWQTAYSTATALGQVSQANGLPTGALIETGSNANGSYTRFADGTQICRHTLEITDITSVAGAIFTTAAEAVWTFPVAFAATDALCVSTGGPRDAGALWARGRAIDAQSAGIRVFAANSTSVTQTVELQATGRWF